MNRKYDIILLVLAVIIIAVIAGMLLSPYLAIALGIIGVSIAGYAMFGIPPR